jgi:Ca-activated chloride channel family protein
MSFAQPEYLWLLLAVPILAGWAIRGRWLARSGWRSLAQRGRVSRDGTLALLGSVACLIVALAQPRWERFGTRLPTGHDVVLVVDASRSMAVEDAVPNRLAVAIEAARSLVSALAPDSGNRAAVVAFAGRAVLRCPLTENLGAVIDALRLLQPGTVRPGGTDLGAALDAALEAFGPEGQGQPRTIVVFSDGEDHAAGWASRLERLSQEDVVVHAVSIGDKDHEHPVPSGKDREPLFYQGAPVLSRRHDTALEAIATGTGGTIVPLGLTTGDLGALYRKKIEPVAQHRRQTPRRAVGAERFPGFLIAALGLLLTGCWPARRARSWGWRLTRAARKLGIAATLIGVVGSSAGALDARSNSSNAPSAAELVARGQAAYDDKRWDEALAAFESAAVQAQNPAISRYNAAATLFQLKRYPEARRRYLEARQRADAALRTKIDYALGNTALAIGDIEGAIAAYDLCLASTAWGAALDVVRRDAAINREFAIQQSQSPALGPPDSAGEQPQTERSDRRKSGARRRGPDDSAPEGQPDDDQGAAGTNPQADSDAGTSANNRRRIGGAGGASSDPHRAGGVPEDRLDAALAHIRAAQARRIPEEQLPVSAGEDRKDW